MSSFEEAFELTGHGIFNYVVLVTCGLVLLYVTVESLGIGFIITAAKCDLNLSSIEKGMINAAAFIGIVATAIFWGYMSDHYGRRAVMLPTLIAAAIFSLASSMSVNFWNMFLLRLLTGCLASASSATVYAYLGEMNPNSHRASAIAWGSTFISFSFIILPALAWVIMPAEFSFSIGMVNLVPWRVFMWLWCVPGLTAAAVLVILPESPRYLYANKGPEVTLPVLARMYAWNNHKKKEDYPVKGLATSSLSHVGTSYKDAFKNCIYMLRPPLLRCVLISYFCMYMVFLLSSGLYTWMPDILNSVLSYTGKSVSICQIMVAKYTKDDKAGPARTGCQRETMTWLLYPMSIMMGAMCTVTFFVIGCVVDKLGKRTIFCTTVATCAVLLAACSVVPNQMAGIILFILGLCCGCAASVLAAITVEVFPTSIRALALCMLYMTGRLGAAVGANMLGFALHHHCEILFLVNTLLTCASTLLMLLWPDPKAVRAEMEGKGFVY